MPPTESPSITCFEADLRREEHGRAVADLVGMYAREPMALGRELPREILEKVPGFLRKFPTAHVFLAKVESASDSDAAAYLGVAVCVLSISTFAASPVMNIHDIAVRPESRGRGIGKALIAEVERVARLIGCSKVTLEVYRDNANAIATYRSCGFADGANAPAPGEIWFFEKKL